MYLFKLEFLSFPDICPGEWGEGGMEWELGVSRCKLLYIEWKNNKVLLYSTGNYIQYPVINHDGKEHKKHIYTHTHTPESLCCTAENDTAM